MKNIKLLFCLLLFLNNSITSLGLDSTQFYLSQSNDALGNFKYKEALRLSDLSITYRLSNAQSPSKEYLQKGKIFKQKGQLDSALFYLNLVETAPNTQRDDYAAMLLQRGKIFKQKGNYSEALNNLKQSLVLFDLLKDSLNIANVKLNIGNVFKGIQQYEYALQNYNEALEIFTQLKLEQKKAHCFNNMGNIYRSLGDMDSTFYYHYKTLEIRKNSNNIMHISFIYHNIALNHEQNGQLDSALYYINKSLKLKFNVGNEIEIYSDYYSLGDIYSAKGDNRNAIYYYNEALKSAQKQNNLYVITKVSKKLADNYYLLNDLTMAAKHYHDYTIYSDSLDVFKNVNSLEKELISYEFVKDSITKTQLLLKKEISEIEKHNLELTGKINQNNITYLTVILAILLILGGLLFISFRKRLLESDSHKSILEIQNKELKRTLISKEEKETLLKEIHHRVKNNLQIINSLIRLQSHYMTAANYQDKLAETENRIRSMALVHEKLYKSNNFSKLNAKTYIQELTTNILNSFSPDTSITVNYNIESNEYSIDTLIPLGLIINEIISNSIKYAFVDHDSGEIIIKLKHDEQNQNTIFELSDNGIGADLTFNELSEDTLGMELIQSLCEQLDGELNLSTETGFKYFFTFPQLK